MIIPVKEKVSICNQMWASLKGAKSSVMPENKLNSKLGSLIMYLNLIRAVVINSNKTDRETGYFFLRLMPKLEPIKVASNTRLDK